MVVYNEDNFELNHFSGIDISVEPEYISESSLYQADNVLIGNSGELIKRPILDGGATMPAGGGLGKYLGPYIYNYTDIAAALYFHIFVRQGPASAKTYMWNTSGTITEVTALAGKPVTGACQVDNSAYVTASDGIWKITNTGAVNVENDVSLQGLTGIIQFQLQMFAWKGDKLFWSNPDDPDNWTAGTNFMIVSSGDGDVIQQCVAYGDKIFIFKTRSTWVLFLTAEPLFWEVRCVNKKIGAVSPQSVIEVDSLMYVQGLQGFYVCDGVVFNKLSDPIAPVFEHRAYNNPAAWVVQYRDWIWVWPGTGAYFYSFRYKDPRGWTRIHTSSLLDVSSPPYLFAHETQPAVFRHAIFNTSEVRLYRDAGIEQVAVTVKTRTFTLARATRLKKVKYGFLIANNKNGAGVTPTTNYETDGLIGENYIFDPLKVRYNNTQAYMIPGPSAFSRTFNLNITETSGTPWTIFSMNFVAMLHRQQSDEQ